MKKVIVCILIMMAALQSTAQSIDPVSLIIAKVIKALDLKIQKMQNETLFLQHAQKIAENALSKTKLTEITGWQNKQVELYEGYFEELTIVKSVLKSLPHVKQILSMQGQVAQEYSRFAHDQQIKPAFDELFEVSKEILQSLQQLLSNKILTMKDADRLMLLTTLRDAMADCLHSTKDLNKQTIHLTALREKMKANIQFMNKLNGKP